jgi:uncharacterized protein
MSDAATRPRRVIDVRARPNISEYMRIFDEPGMDWAMDRFGFDTPPTVSLEQFVAEMDELNIEIALYSGRDSIEFRLPNDHVAEVASRYPKRFVGYAGIDVADTPRALTEITRAQDELGLTGVSLDPAPLGWMADDRRLYPIYAECESRGLPVLITLGPLAQTTGYMEYGSPLPVDRVATDFPALKLLCAHGTWPWVLEMMAVAFRHDNVFFDASAWFRLPGHETLVKAVNDGTPHIADRFVFGSALPFNPLKAAIDDFAGMGWTDDALDRVLYRNAAEFLGLDAS